MAAIVTCIGCDMNQHHPNAVVKQTQPGVLGGWICGCPCTHGDDVPDRELPDMQRLFDDPRGKRWADRLGGGPGTT